MTIETAPEITRKDLIIDGEKRSRSNLIRALQKIGAVDPEVSDNVLSAMKEFRAQRFAYVFIDSLQTVLPAQEAIKNIRADALWHGAKYLLIQKNLDLAQTVACLQAGFDGFITKPFHYDFIAQTLSLLDRKKDKPGRERLIIADGNERYRRSLAALLSKHYAISEAITGFDALVYYEQYLPKKIILSSTLDVIGFESIIHKMKNTQAEVPTNIYVTLFDTSGEMHDRMHALGITAILKRTVDEETLLQSLEEAGLIHHAGSIR